jgi:hypothetical protein
MVLMAEKYRTQRILCGIMAIALGLIALSTAMPTGLSENTAAYIQGTFGKVAIVLAISWLSWPQLVWIKEAPGGGMVILAIVFGAAIFVARPRLLWYFIPLLVGGSILFVAITWLQRQFKS